jgi:class 3 adenylate cyclase
VACLFSDIRGYTKRPKSVQGFVQNSAIPNINSCVQAVEEMGGIPRTIGDLVFAYYDLDSVETNLVNALSSAIKLYDTNQRLNEQFTDDLSVERHILVSTGLAVVGNLGGHNSSREITAMGSPVNILDRIDQASKEPALKDLIQENDVILTNDAAEVLQLARPEVQIKRVNLEEIDIAIRDYPTERILWLMPINDFNRRQLVFDLDILNELKEGSAS